MSTYVALLRAVNVGGTSLPMAEFRRILGELGFGGVRTYLQSGNAVFEADDGEVGRLADAIAVRIERDLGPRVGVLVLSGHDLAQVLAGNPFLGRGDVDERYLHATLLFAPEEDFGAASDDAASDVFASAFVALTLPAADGEEAEFAGRPEVSRPVIYLYLPHGYGRSKLTNAYFERQLGTAATTRNWRTMLALGELAAAKA